MYVVVQAALAVVFIGAALVRGPEAAWIIGAVAAIGAAIVYAGRRR